MLAAVVAGLTIVGQEPAPARAQTHGSLGGELPPPGDLVLDLSPRFESWSQQFPAAGDSVPGGDREPLHADYGGPLVDRLYPGPELVVASINRGADSLGFAPMEPGELSLGSLEFGNVTVHRTRLPFRAMLGVTERIAVDAGISFTQARTDLSFRYDSTGATAAPASLALEDGSTFLDGMASARSSLESRLQSGELSPEEEAAARELLERSGAFAAVLERRLSSGGLLPLAGSRPGDEMSVLASELRSSFQSFDIEAPSLGLASSPGPGALSGFLTGPLVEGEPLGGEDPGLQPTQLDLGVRVGLLDTFGPDDDSDTTDAGRGRPSGMALRTTAGLRVRWPLGEPDAAPFLTPDRFMDTPAGAGARVVEASLYQDVAYRALRLSAAAGYGRRLADEVTIRVHDPGRPFALAAARRELRREPGDYLWLRVAPAMAVNRHLSMGAEYAFWRQGRSGFTALGPEEGEDGDGGTAAVDPADLEAESVARRHSVGVGVSYHAAGTAGEGLQASFTYLISALGSGGQTPASNLMDVRIRIPVSLGLF